jgi:hypothetical protein
MALFRTTAIAFALSSTVLLAGCNDSNSAPGSGSGSPTPTPGAAVAWASSVCSASTELQASVQDADKALQVHSSSPATSLDQARAEVGDHVAAVQQSAASLRSALSAVPTGVDPQWAAVQQQLQTASKRAQGAVDQLGAAAGQVANAQTAADVATSLATLKAGLVGTAHDLATYLESLRGTVNGGERAVRNAFDAAPACQGLTA